MASAILEEEETELNFGKFLVRTFSASAPPDTKRDAQWKVERLNLLNIANLCILIDSALKLGKGYCHFSHPGKFKRDLI